MTIKIQRYGWKPQIPDHRDFTFLVLKTAKMPTNLDLCTSGYMPVIYDQGELGSCVANATGAAFEYELKKQKLPDFMPSRLFIYYQGRVLENTVKYDSGLEVRDGLKVVNKFGVCPETDMPYDITKFTDAPTDNEITSAALNKATVYQAVAQNLLAIKTALFQGQPVVFGFTVYSNFESANVARTGTVNMPLRSETVLGGHSVCIVGYDDRTQRFKCRNSWGTSWGQKGYFTMPYAYVTNPRLASDFWIIKTVS